MDAPQRLEIRQKQPNPVFEHWLKRWLEEAEKRNSKSQYKLREALQALRCYPLPLQTGRECAVLRGFGVKLCNLIDEEIQHLQSKQANESIVNTSTVFQQEVQMVVDSVKKAKRKRKSPTKQPSKLNKKLQQALIEEEERQRSINMAPGHFRIWLLVDTQETNTRSKRQVNQTSGYLDTLDIQYEVRRLTVGDFMWVARDESGGELVLPYIVERKRMDDLASSIRDGRFHEQKHRLQNCGIQHVYYLVEDRGNNECVSLPLDTLRQAMVNTQVHTDFKVVHVENHWRAIEFLKNMTNTLIRMFKDKMLIGTEKEDLIPTQPNDAMVGLMKFRDLYEDSARNAELNVREVFLQQLLQLHSLSLEKALAIVEVYPTPRLLFDAYEACESVQEARKLLSRIRFGKLQRAVGDKISETVYEFYNTEFES